jgi:hypothetical protein
MAKVRDNVLVKGFSGTTGRQLMATAYARRAIKDPEMKAMYQAVVKGGQRAFNIAMIDALQAPVVESIQADNYNSRAGDLIIVRATDNFKVAGVVVSIHNQAGDLIEEGDAIMQENEEMEWLYNVHQNNLYYSGSTIIAVAIDLPGNSSSLKMNVP